MADSTEVSTAALYEFGLTAGREEIADVLNGVVDGVLTGAFRLGSGADAVSVGPPEDLPLEIELEDDEDELSRELDWPAPAEGSTDPSIENRPGGASEEPPLVSAADGSESLARVEGFRDRGEEWRWRLRHRIGNVIASSGEGDARKHDAQTGLRSVVENAPAAEMTEPSTD